MLGSERFYFLQWVTDIPNYCICTTTYWHKSSSRIDFYDSNYPHDANREAVEEFECLWIQSVTLKTFRNDWQRCFFDHFLLKFPHRISKKDTGSAKAAHFQALMWLWLLKATFMYFTLKPCNRGVRFPYKVLQMSAIKEIASYLCWKMGCVCLNFFYCLWTMISKDVGHSRQSRSVSLVAVCFLYIFGFQLSQRFRQSYWSSDTETSPSETGRFWVLSAAARSTGTSPTAHGPGTSAGRRSALVCMAGSASGQDCGSDWKGQQSCSFVVPTCPVPARSHPLSGSLHSHHHLPHCP